MANETSENRGPQLLGIDHVFVVLAVVAVALRCYARIGIVKAFGLDDYIMVTFIIYSSFSINGAHHGTGRHRIDLETSDFQQAMMSWWLCYLFYSLTMITCKISIGCLLLRVAVRKYHQWIIYAAIAITFIAGLALFFVTLFQCHPISRFWDQSLEGACINTDVIIALGYLYSCFAIISDFTFAILPAFIIYGLNMTRRAKMALIPLMAMGTIASCGVLARLPYLPHLKSKDFLWETTDIAIWSTVEQGLAIIAGSLASTRPLVKVLSIKLGFTRSTNTSKRLTELGTGPGINGARSSKGAPELYSLSENPKDSCGWKRDDDTEPDVERQAGLVGVTRLDPPTPEPGVVGHELSGNISKVSSYNGSVPAGESFLIINDKKSYDRN